MPGPSPPDLIAAYVETYSSIEREAYLNVAKTVSKRLGRALESAHVRHSRAHRAKDPGRLELKLRARQANRKEPYESVQEIKNDIADLAGVRVALYFPDDEEVVCDRIRDLFRLGVEQDPKIPSRFQVGYRGIHFRVFERVSPSTAEQPLLRCEIQIATVLRHAWAEVEHDLAYKPFEGEISQDEHALLSTLNGIVAGGEVVLRELGEARRRRLLSAKPLRNADELGEVMRAAEILTTRKFADKTPDTADTGTHRHPEIGRPDVLFATLQHRGENDIAHVQAYLAEADERGADNPTVAQSRSRQVLAILSPEDVRDATNRLSMALKERRSSALWEIEILTQQALMDRRDAKYPDGMPILPQITIAEATSVMQDKSRKYRADEASKVVNFYVSNADPRYGPSFEECVRDARDSGASDHEILNAFQGAGPIAY